MYIFDAHCDYLWAKAMGEESQLEGIKDTKLKKSIFAVFEGADIDKNLIQRETELFFNEKPVEETYIAFEGLSWVNSLWDLDDILKYNPVYVGPMWNNKNNFGGSAYDDMPLTVFGQCFLKELDDKNIFIDLAHSGEEMFESSIYNFENVIFSHGNVFDICNHPRNLKKNQIKKLIQRKSFMGLTLYSGFVGGKSIDKFFEHVEYVLDMGGEDILGIGSDLDGCSTFSSRYDDVRIFNELIEEFYKRNYSISLIKGILHKNLEKTLKKVICSQKSR